MTVTGITPPPVAPVPAGREALPPTGSRCGSWFTTPLGIALLYAGLGSAVVGTAEIAARWVATQHPEWAWAHVTAGFGVVALTAILLDVLIRRGQRARQAADRRFAELADTLPEPLFEADAAGRLVWGNRAALTVFGYTPADLARGVSIADTVVPGDRPRVQDRLLSTLAGQGQPGTECTACRKDGSTFPVMVYASPIVRDGRPAGLRGLILDMTVPHAAAQALRDSEARYRALAEAARDLIFIIGRDDRIEYVNRYAAEWLRREPEQLTGLARTAVFPPEIATGQGRSLQRVFDTGVDFYIETPVALFGTNRWLGTSLVPLRRDANGVVLSVLGVSRDITERKQAEEGLRQSDATARALLDATGDPAFLTDTTGTILAVNDAAARNFNRSAASLLGVRCFGLLEPPLAAERERLFAQVLATGQPVHFTSQWQGRWLDNSIRPVLDSAGKVIKVSFYGHDITERQRAEEATREAEREKSVVLNALSELVIYQDRELRVRWANRAAAESVGQRPEALVGRHCYEIWHHRDDPCVDCPVVRALTTGEPASGETRTPDGRVFWMTGHPVRNDAGEIIGAVEATTEITARRQAETALQERSLQVDMALLATGMGIWRHDLATDALTVVRPGGPITGLPPDAPPASFAKLLEAVHPDDRERLAHSVREATAAGLPHHVEFRVTLPGQNPVWVASTGRMVRDASGKPLALMGTDQDITAHRLLEEQFRQAQKMEAVGRLAGGVAHDFNNLLTAIQGYAELLLHQLPPADPLRQHAAAILDAGGRAAAVTGQLLAFSRRQVLQRRIVELNTVVTDMEGLLRRLLGEDLTLVLRLAPEAGHIKADSGQLGQVIMNLAVNARDAMPRGGTLTLETGVVQYDAQAIGHHPGMPPGRYARLTISDTGVGMDEGTRSHLFEPFFTTKEIGKGTGLGLSTVYGIVKQSGGLIRIDSAPNRGTSVRIDFPQVRAPAAAAAAPAGPAAELRGTETILLAEDSLAVRELVTDYLRHLGYTVLAAADADAALRLAAAHAGPLPLLVTDVAMPGLSGGDLAERLRVQRPGLRVLYVSGHLDAGLGRGSLPDGGGNFLQKPFSVQELAFMIRALLARPAA